MSDFFENMDLNVKEARASAQGLCLLIILGTALYHVYLYHGGLLGCVIFTVLALTTLYLAEENVAHQYMNVFGRLVMVTVVLGFVVYVGGMEMTPVAIILLAMLGAIEFLYKVYESLQERINRLEDDVNFLYDENAAAENDDDEEEENSE
ncbi:hypothetical protein CAEBREN_25647 [Caenorhabditis brenneri]|uniref:Uncharacterized protein n=1 Tax=Caenorhabditis brenneri TaxID=135651 RepID=G0MJD7_CAEBE|nr:hypothetical protein CAEBREN_25647 [Caenorhabditis brenneri]